MGSPPCYDTTEESPAERLPARFLVHVTGACKEFLTVLRARF